MAFCDQTDADIGKAMVLHVEGDEIIPGPLVTVTGTAPIETQMLATLDPAHVLLLYHEAGTENDVAKILTVE